MGRSPWMSQAHEARGRADSCSSNWAGVCQIAAIGRGAVLGDRPLSERDNVRAGNPAENPVSALGPRTLRTAAMQLAKSGILIAGKWNMPYIRSTSKPSVRAWRVSAWVEGQRCIHRGEARIPDAFTTAA